MIELLKQADEIVKAYPLYRRFIDGSPLVNDIPVWMAEFATLQIKLANERHEELSKTCSGYLNIISKQKEEINLIKKQLEIAVEQEQTLRVELNKLRINNG